MIEIRMLMPANFGHGRLQYRHRTPGLGLVSLGIASLGEWSEWKNVEVVTEDAQGQGNTVPADGPARDSDQSGVKEASSQVEGIPDSPTDY